MKILVIDAQGGGLGRQIVLAIKKTYPNIVVTAVGTNSMATANMLKAGADHSATGENAVIVGCRNVDVIIGPIGMMTADSMHGEITPRMVVAIGQSEAKRIIIPVNQCNNTILGISDLSINKMIEQLLILIQKQIKNEEY